MDVHEYSQDLFRQIEFEALQNSTDNQAQFTEWALDKLEGYGELLDPYPFECVTTIARKKVAFDAYAFDEADSSIVLLISEFNNSSDKVNLTQTRIDELYEYMRRFIEESYANNVRNYCDDSDPVIDISREFRKKIGKNKYETEILKFKFYIVTNCELSQKIKSFKKDDLLERPVELNVWTVDRFYQRETAISSESIHLDCAQYGIPNGMQCLKANIGNHGDYDAYLAIVPGKFLADVYLEHGSRLLEGNVRSFLSARGKVNKQIRETINSLDNRHNFFIYNNGIAVVANKIGLSQEGRIMSFDDFQIINGGQTTASLANCLIKKESDLNDIYVPMKLTVLNIENDTDRTEENIAIYERMTQQISKCANCQNPVSDADFFSNHPYHIQIEQLSQKHPAPYVDGQPYQTIWFYERARGSWEQSQMKMTQAQRDKFRKIHPKSQLITKAKLAKCLNSVYMNPHMVCSSSNMKSFAGIVEDLWKNSKDNINEFYFQKAVGSVILFDTIDKIVADATGIWYDKGGNKAQIVPYTVSKLISMIPDNKDIDWLRIWKYQKLYPSLAHQAEIVAQEANLFIAESGGMIAREYARKADTWKKFRDDYRIKMTEEFSHDLVSKTETKAHEARAKKAHKFNSDIDLSVQVFNLGAAYWTRFYTDMEKTRLLNASDTNYIGSVIRYVTQGRLLTGAQCKKLLKIINLAEDLGYIMPEK